MKEQNYNLNNLGNTFYLFKRDDEKMIDDIKKFALKYRNKIESDLGLDNTQAGFMQQILNKKIWADKTYSYNQNKNKNTPKNFLDFFLNWGTFPKDKSFNEKLIAKFLESSNRIPENLDVYFIVTRAQLKDLLGGRCLVGEIKKEMKREPLSIDIFDLKDRYQSNKINDEQYKYFQKMEQNLFSLIAHEELFKTIINNSIGKKNETEFFIMKDLIKNSLRANKKNHFGNHNGFKQDLWKNNKFF